MCEVVQGCQHHCSRMANALHNLQGISPVHERAPEPWQQGSGPVLPLAPAPQHGHEPVPPGCEHALPLAVPLELLMLLHRDIDSAQGSSAGHLSTKVQRQKCNVGHVVVCTSGLEVVSANLCPGVSRVQLHTVHAVCYAYMWYEKWNSRSQREAHKGSSPIIAAHAWLEKHDCYTLCTLQCIPYEAADLRCVA